MRRSHIWMFVVTIIFGCLPRVEANPSLQAQKGVLDLSNWQPDETRSTPLGGEWNLYWARADSEASLAEGVLLDVEPTAVISPGKFWRDLKPGITQDFGYATYTLRVDGLKAEAGRLGVTISQFANAHKTWLYQPSLQRLTKLSDVGRIGQTRSDYVPQNKKVVTALPELDGQPVYFITQTTSYLTAGGYSYPPELGYYEVAVRADRNIVYESLWILGMFCLLFISNLSLFLLRRNDIPSLIMSAFTLVMGLRYFSTEALWARFFPEPNFLSFVMLYYVIAFALPLGLTLYLQFFSFTFPGRYPRWAMRSAWVINGIFIAVSVFGLVRPGAPSIFNIVILSLLGLATLMFWRLLGMTWRRERGAGLSLLGITILVGSMANDVFVWLRAYEFIYVGHYGMIAFIFTQSLVVGSNFAHAFNTAERLSRDLQLEVDRQTRDVKTILRNIHQGILTVRPGMTVGDDYSNYLETILGTKEIAHRPALELVFQSCNLNQEQMSMVQTILEGCLNENVLNFEVNAENLLHEVVYKDPKGREKILLVDWDPVVNEKTDVIEKILVTLRDVTELKAMEARNRQQQRDMELISEIIEIPSDRFANFLESSRRFLDENERLIKGTKTPSEEVLKIVFINYHTIKGAARTYRFTGMTGIVHDAEHFVASVQKGAVAWNSERALQELAQVQKVFEDYERINRDKLKRVENKNIVQLELETVRENILAIDAIGEVRLDERLTPFVDQVKRTFYHLYFQDINIVVEDIVRMLPQLARDLKKLEPEVVLQTMPVGLTKEAVDTLRDVFIHVMRNIMDHGLESPDIREANGKPTKGRITIATSLAGDGYLRLRTEDDGQGIRLDRIAEIARQKGLMTSEIEKNPQEVANLIFVAGFSTAKGLTDVSGRGVGMSAVREYVEKAGGRVELTLLEKPSTLRPVKFCLDILLPPQSFTVFQEERQIKVA